jgi:hypothetical protein
VEPPASQPASQPANQPINGSESLSAATVLTHMGVSKVLFFSGRKGKGGSKKKTKKKQLYKVKLP